MQILSAEQIRLWDKFTIAHEPVSSVDLMERAAARCMQWLTENNYIGHSFSIFCGKGNNGGDGLALARLLAEKECRVIVHILEFGHKGTEEFQGNLARLHLSDVEIRFIQTAENLHSLPPEDIVIDALFGCGLNRPLEGVTAELIKWINQSGNEIIAIDIPSGMYVDRSSRGNAIIRATHTLSFQCYKLAFVMAENAPYTGIIHILDIGLHPDYFKDHGGLELTDMDFIRAIYKPRKPFSHKGNFGHALLVVGSYGKMGAAVLAARSCQRSGAGLLTCHIPGCGYNIMQTALPEAMVMTDKDDHINTSTDADLSLYSVIAVGPGIGKDDRTRALLESILRKYRSPMVLDADALNILAADQSLPALLPPYSVLTPHPKEFERLFGACANDFERLQSAIEKSKQYQSVIVLKGHYTFIALPDGAGYFNPTGNAGMAKGGSGDVLTGIIAALLAQGYSASEAAIFGVYLHGWAGDLAASVFSQPSMLPSDLTDCLGKAFLMLETGFDR